METLQFETSQLETLQLEKRHPLLTVTINRPDVANAMNLKMVHELMEVAQLIERDGYRILVIKGSGGHFCAGGDIQDMQGARGDKQALKNLNRAFGEMLTRLDQTPAIVITALQGAVLGGGFGLACISDVAIADGTAKFGMPETSLGIVPAQIAPFVVKRIGLTQARRLALLGLKIRSEEAVKLGVIHQQVADAAELDGAIDATIQQALKGAPRATINTKELLHGVQQEDLGQLLDRAAAMFADAVTGDEGKEGAMAFIEKRKAAWAQLD